jgi:xylulokinase
VCVLETEEGPALGAAMLAAVGTGKYESVGAAADSIVKVVEVLKPDAEIAARYDKKYQQFKEIYPALKPVFDKMSEE